MHAVKALELGHMVAAAYAAKQTADLGADISKIEKSDCDRARHHGPFLGRVTDPQKSGFFPAAKTNKQRKTLALQNGLDHNALPNLAAWADILIHNYSPLRMAAFGIDCPSLETLNPGQVMFSVTPFRLTGPRRPTNELSRRHGEPPEFVAFPPRKSNNLATDPHLNAQDYIVRLTHPEVGERIHTGISWHLTHFPNGV